MTSKQYDSSTITIDSIAAACGKSRTTVSVVLRGEAEKYRIHSKTAELVKSTSERLGWKPNFFARSLNKKRTNTIGVIFPDIFEHFMGEIVRGVESVLQTADYRMLLSTSRFDWREEIKSITNFQYRGVDGLIIVPCADFISSNHSEHVPEMIKQIGPRPCVILDRAIPNLDPLKQGYGFVIQSDYRGAYEAIQYLANYKKAYSIGYLSFNLEASSLQQRLKAFQDACRDLNLPNHTLLLDSQNSQDMDIIQYLQKLSHKKVLPQHWLVASEGLSYRLASLLNEMGYRLGKDVHIARFGSDIPFNKTEFINIIQPHGAMGTAAAEMILKLINIPEKTELYRELQVTIEKEKTKQKELS